MAYAASYDKSLVARGKEEERKERGIVKRKEKKHNPPEFKAIGRNSKCKMIKYNLFIVKFLRIYY